jgi:transcriptional regulator with XRE-family HTH domain
MTEVKEFNEKIFADRLKVFRKQYVHKSQIQAAKLLKVSQSYLWYMENGQGPISYEFLKRLQDSFGLNMEWFGQGHGKPTEKEPKKANLVTDINALNMEIESLKNGIKILEATQNHLLKRMIAMEQEIAKNAAKKS